VLGERLRKQSVLVLVLLSVPVLLSVLVLVLLSVPVLANACYMSRGHFPCFVWETRFRVPPVVARQLALLFEEG